MSAKQEQPQVRNNLLYNACTHTPADTPVHVRVGSLPDDRLQPAAATPVSVIEIADEGPGIHPDDAPHVLDRFYRATAQGELSEPGSGLGLAIATAIATAHGGRLELDNRPGQGCTFRLLLPHQPPPAPHVRTL
ncbi:ATP-binding protein [Streptomyces xanthophaeus]|uniref:ATP-binding protein n=1 Tax=Streptomyces xanthophaeus TaxID=67385 RepID=UPI00099D9DC0